MKLWISTGTIARVNTHVFIDVLTNSWNIRKIKI